MFPFHFPQGKTSVYPINSHVAVKIVKAGGMNAYYKTDRLFNFNFWIIPIHLGVHWAMMVGVFLKVRPLVFPITTGCGLYKTENIV